MGIFVRMRLVEEEGESHRHIHLVVADGQKRRVENEV